MRIGYYPILTIAPNTANIGSYESARYLRSKVLVLYFPTIFMIVSLSVSISPFNSNVTLVLPLP